MLLSNSTAGQFARFVAVAPVSFGLNLLVTAVVHEMMGLPEEGSFAVALVTVFTFNFFVGRHVIFRSNEGDPRRQLVRYALSSGGFRLAEYLGFLIVHTGLNVHYIIAAMLVLGTSFICKFFFYGKVVFTNDRSV